jgi:hypothetical protein
LQRVEENYIPRIANCALFAPQVPVTKNNGRDHGARANISVEKTKKKKKLKYVRAGEPSARAWNIVRYTPLVARRLFCPSSEHGAETRKLNSLSAELHL